MDEMDGWMRMRWMRWIDVIDGWMSENEMDMY